MGENQRLNRDESRPEQMKTTIRYAVTHVGPTGGREIMGTCYDLACVARDTLRYIRENPTIADLVGKSRTIGTFEVRPIECDEEGNPMGILAKEES